MIDSSSSSERKEKFAPKKMRRNFVNAASLNLLRGMATPFPRLSRMIDKVKEQKTDLNGFNIYEAISYIIFYLGFGVVAYSFVLPERWSIINSLYFCVCTMTTIGHGDLIPITTVSKMFTCVFACGGIAFLSIALASIGANLIEGEMQAIAKGKADELKNQINKLTDYALSRDEDGKEVSVDGKKPAAGAISSPSKATAIRKAAIPFVSILSFGGLMLSFLEHWHFAEGIYYALMTATTLGYGDFAPTTPLARLFAVCFYPVLVAATGSFFGSVSTFLLNRQRDKRNKATLNRELTIERIFEMDADGNGEVSKSEYIAFMLVELQMVEQDLLEQLFAQFDKLDVSGDGCLSEDDLEDIMKYTRENKAPALR